MLSIIILLVTYFFVSNVYKLRLILFRKNYVHVCCDKITLTGRTTALSSLSKNIFKYLKFTLEYLKNTSFIIKFTYIDNRQAINIPLFNINDNNNITDFI